MQIETSTKPDWLIDVKDQCIIRSTPETATYFTLSYTWGNADSVANTSNTLDRLRERNSLHPDSGEIVPRTVRDAMGITECLGERYLWVDRLCIVQDDQAALGTSLNAMHHIYANSALCLIALAGKDANHGLRGFRGISEPRSLEHVAFDIGKGNKVCWFNKPLGLFDADEKPESDIGLTWDERGWTYQEFIFAKRRLVFTDGPLRWVCRRSILREETCYDKGDEYLAQMQMPSVSWMEQPRPALGQLCHFAAQFNQRHFTYPEDALKAFLGVQNFMNGYFLGGFNHGHPEMFFDYSLLWTAEPEVERRVPSAGVHFEEDNLPSWSWLGWKGGFEFLCDHEYEEFKPFDGMREPVAQWFAMQSPSTPPANRRAINCRWHHYKTIAQGDSAQVPEGWKRDGRDYRFKDERFCYPVPLPSSTIASEPAVQLQFLFAKTSRAFFEPRILEPSEGKPTPDRLSQLEYVMELRSATQQFAGLLRLHKKSDMDQFLAKKTVEIVAVTKGWTSNFSDYLWYMDDLGGDERCYFGLCIRWENGVAKRLCTAKIRHVVWEKYQEPVDLVLG